MHSLADKTPRLDTAAADARPFDLRARLLAMPRYRKRMLQVSVDIPLIWLSLWLAFALRLDDPAAAHPFGAHAWLFALAPLLTIPVLARGGLYRAVLRYLGMQALWTIAKAIGVSAILLALAVWLYGPSTPPIPRSIVAIHALLNLILLGGLRLLLRCYFQSDLPVPTPHRRLGNTPAQARANVAIYGAGAAGNQLLVTLHGDRRRRVVAFLDDNTELQGRTISGLPVYDPAMIGRLADRLGLSEVLLAIPSASRSRRRAIIERLASYPFAVRTIPGFHDLASGKLTVDDVHEVGIADLLGRDPVQPDIDLLERCIRDQVVMVTGAGGSIGSELCRQILHNGPRTLILFEQSEYNLYNIQCDLEDRVRQAELEVRIVPILNSVRDQQRLFDVMSTWNVDTVYHAAAYKHVPMVERNMAEGILNNVFGTLYSAQAALRAGVTNFVLISTDKAVRPTNTMGCTKRMAELVLQALACESHPNLYGDPPDIDLPNRTRFTMVRFGNVLGSSGSVVPRFRSQIKSGGPVTVTHPDITRYFMTIPEAAMLVIQAGSMGLGGDVFVLDMGEPVKIRDLAEKMILLSGLTVRSHDNPDGDIAIEYVGLRPGEKLYEELLIGADVLPTRHPMIMRANENRIDWETLKGILDELAGAIADDNYPRIRALFLEVVDGYHPECDMVDWIHLHHSAEFAALVQDSR